MLRIKPNKFSMACVSLLSLSLLSSAAFGYNDDRVSYLDSVSSSYLYSNDNSPQGKTLLNMNSDEARGFETTLKLDNSTPITKSNAIINISLRESDIRQSLRMLADKAGLNIVFDESVEGKLTLDLKNIRINDAFMAIFKSSQLTYNLDGNTLTVMTIAASKDLAYTRKNLTVIPIRYVNASSVAKFLNENLFQANIFGLSNQPIVTTNPRTNQIMVFGSQQDILAVKRVIPLLDTKPMENEFTISHTTPKEMAQLICDAFFSVKNETSDVGSASSTESEDTLAIGTGTVACRDNFGEDGESSGSSDTGAKLSAFKAAPLTIIYFSELGKISIQGGSIEQVQMIRDFIKTHDKKQLMAYIELSIIELNETGSKEFNNSWKLYTPFLSLGYSQDGGFSVGSGNGQLPLYIWKKDYVTGASVTNNKALLYTLNYSIENGNGRTLSNPKIMVTNGKKTVIDMSSDYVASVTSQVLETSNGLTSGTQKTYNISDDAGITIELTPFISPDGYVSMNITPDYAVIKQKIHASAQSTDDSDIQATLLQRRNLELKGLRVKDGETLVLAGFMKEDEQQTVKKMPILADLPFIGVFFRNSSNEKAREELVITVTPHIIKDQDNNNNVYDL